jgi:hypothetical protein
MPFIIYAARDEAREVTVTVVDMLDNWVTVPADERPALLPVRIPVLAHA